ncbi:choice-of-anchor D domain-containing protein [Pseudofrankia sp. BMG5.36]|uniref:choice-of-anchor D domain-containing protein n=1 Tax=Pseudofrankia sp. BMG5.36 TaxID=1834512 RepID=UPI001F52B41C|nr:choice-of-anchor D domain-containing protein [Pseudofrankia sp. BMG5.36]
MAVVSATGFQCEYKPTALPIKFTFDENGNVDVSVSHDIVTPIGVFELSQSVTRPRNVPPGQTMLIIRHAIAGVLKDSWFQLRLAKDLVFSVDGGSRLVEQSDNAATLEVTGPATGVVVQETEDDGPDDGPGRFSTEQVDALPEVPDDADGAADIDVTPSTLLCSADGCEESVTISGTGDGPLRVTSVEVLGPDADLFVPSHDCDGRELSAGEQCSLTVDFTPPEGGGVATATLVIHQNLAGPASEIDLKGDGNGLVPTPETVEPGEPGIAVTPSTLLCAGDRCAEPVTIRSTGTGPLKVTSVEVVGPGAGSFVPSHDCDGRELSADEECSLAVDFTPPEDGGVADATLVIHQNLAGPPTEVALQGS